MSGFFSGGHTALPTWSGREHVQGDVVFDGQYPCVWRGIEFGYGKSPYDALSSNNMITVKEGTIPSDENKGEIMPQLRIVSSCNITATSDKSEWDIYRPDFLHWLSMNYNTHKNKECHINRYLDPNEFDVVN